MRGFWVLGYGLLLVYGSLFPFEHLPWDTPVAVDRLFDWEAARRSYSAPDVLVNLLVYFPWGWLVVARLDFLPVGWAMAAAVLSGFGLSLTVEYWQLFFPARVASLGDVAMNTLGTGLGALAGIAFRRLPLGARCKTLILRWVRADPLADLGALALACWALSELTPLVPSLDLSALKHGVKPLWEAWQGIRPLKAAKAWVALLHFTALGLLLFRILQPKAPFGRIFWAVLGGVLLAKIPIVGRQLSLEAGLGLIGASLGLAFLKGLEERAGSVLGIVLVLAAQVTEALTAEEGGRVVPTLNWIPFAAQQHGITGLIDILLGIWPYLTLGFFAHTFVSEPRRWLAALLGGAAVFSLALYLEWCQRSIPGRYPDATDAYLAWAAFAYAMLKVKARPEAPALAWRPQVKGRLWLYGLAAVVSLTTGRLVWMDSAAGHKSERALPRPEELPAPNLPQFRFAHPRLPAPSPLELLELKRRNPSYLRLHAQKAQRGEGDFYSIALVALADPAQIDLNRVVERLTGLQYVWRGHEQAQPLAVVYDWLYPKLSSPQRQRLQEKLAEGCRYLADYIRKEALSPYNVYFYNRPFQALMAVALSLYGDHPQGEPCLAFAYELWKHRVLPVWRQVMGKAGGWHEGGEYVGIGIGQAIWSVPAMWRSATGEDLFASEPGIRGFLDFLLFRRRPDGTHMRWGDGAFFDREEPERFALALEYRHRAAYRFFGCLRNFQPTAWPWGPLPDDSLCDPGAVATLPLEKWFDGIGMVIARSDWSREATYVTFKAGDNFWSHSHLDQGSFTLYKGAELIVDSGVYGPHYGSDHHLNYAYQTIAHNTLTVTDPKDTAWMPGKDEQEPRPIANDGGQRRVGSGWGKRAPIDLAEWQENFETYHTGKILRYFAGDDLIVAVADLTPAYTNRRCGKGNFYDRTCRVQRYVRTFVYDRKEDTVLIHDDASSTDPSFIKRVLLHTQERPRVLGNKFFVEVLPDPARNQVGGRLEGEVLFPKEAWLNLVGGRGAEFWVDGRNYDEEGKIWPFLARYRRHPPEPGRWRIEIVPPVAQRRDRFLVALKPSLFGRENLTQVQLRERAGEFICRLLGPERVVELSYPSDRSGLVLNWAGRQVDLTVP
nr:hypothetical conserved protein [uncultured Gammaproteobacteria bacterium]